MKSTMKRAWNALVVGYNHAAKVGGVCVYAVGTYGLFENHHWGRWCLATLPFAMAGCAYIVACFEESDNGEGEENEQSN